jgi:predicted hydrocarbon binding protein
MAVLSQRETLGDFMSAICFQYLRINTEEVAGRAPILSAGRRRGHDVIEGAGLLGASSDPAVIHAQLDAALGLNGTRLCLIQSITRKDDGGYEVRLKEGACTAGQSSSEPICAFTLGVFIGAISAITGIRMNGRELECQACGVPMCVYSIDPI